MKEKKEINIGGQAVIEGVMMRSPKFVSIAVRKQDGKIILKRDPYISWTKRFKLLGIPFMRGGIILIESLILGIKALNFSGNVAIEEAEKEKNQKEKMEKFPKLGTGIMVILAFFLGLGLFFYLPLVLTELTGVKGGVMFNILDGGIRLAIFLLYLALISLWKEIHRVFEYHGAEHKSIFAYENGKPLTLENVKSFSTHHPRCGTSFLLVVMLVSLVVFIILGRPHDLGDRLTRFLFIPLIGGISYEIIRLSGKKSGKKIAKILVAPGLWLQKITTKNPDDKQLEVALVALKSALDQNVESAVEIVSS